MGFEIAIVTVIVLDQLFGDPRWLPHPVKIIGTLCNFCERIFRRICSNEKVAGICTVTAVVLMSAFFTFVLLLISFLLAPLFGTFVAVIILYTTIAARDLARHSKHVHSFLHPHVDLEAARKAVGMIVGRDTQQLDEREVSRACVETVAENMVDGVTAPLFYGILCGLASSGTYESIGYAAVGAMTYKAINTMDSMFGYKNKRYLHFGWAAARLDDFVNFIPARISAFLLIPAAALLRLDWKKAAKIFWRDRLNHASPNAAHPEAAVAGALGIQLGGCSSYFGKMVSKPTMGDGDRDIRPKDILTVNKLMLMGSLLFVVCMLLLRKTIVGL